MDETKEIKTPRARPAAPLSAGARESQPRRYSVTVRHSPFRLKRAVVEAASEAEARQAFVREALRHAGSLTGKSDGFMKSQHDATRNLDAYEWLIEPAVEEVAA